MGMDTDTTRVVPFRRATLFVWVLVAGSIWIYAWVGYMVQSKGMARPGWRAACTPG